MELFWAAVGALLGFLLTIVLQPLLEQRLQDMLVGIFGSITQRKQSIAGEWQQTWTVDSLQYPKKNTSDVTVKQFGRRVSAKFVARGRTYFLRAEVSQGQFVTGTWFDETAGSTYHGAFQMRIDPVDRSMSGQWIGFAQDNSIKNGPWEWVRK